MFAFSIVLLVLAVVVAGASFAVRAEPTRRWTRVGSAGLGALFVVVLVLSCFATVGAQDIGVKTTFGHISGHVGSGLSVKAPWERVTRLDDAVQTDTYASNQDGSTQANAQGGCVNARIARQAVACVNVSIRYQILGSGVDELFRAYRNNATIQDRLIHRDLQTAVNVAFASYDPLGLDSAGNSTQPSETQLAAKVQQTMSQDVPQVTIVSVSIPLFTFDQGTQDRLNQLQAQVAQTRIAQQAQQTAAAQAAANAALAASVSNDPGVLESKCLDILQDAVNKGQQLPAGFSCFGGTGATVAVSGAAK